jgi:hypothetical protein
VLITCILQTYVSQEYVSHRHVSHRRASRSICISGMCVLVNVPLTLAFLVGARPIYMYVIGVYLGSMHLTSVHFISVHLISAHLTSVHLRCASHIVDLLQAYISCRRGPFTGVHLIDVVSHRCASLTAMHLLQGCISQRASHRRASWNHSIWGSGLYPHLTSASSRVYLWPEFPIKSTYPKSFRGERGVGQKNAQKHPPQPLIFFLAPFRGIEINCPTRVIASINSLDATH